MKLLKFHRITGGWLDVVLPSETEDPEGRARRAIGEEGMDPGDWDLVGEEEVVSHVSLDDPESGC